MAQRRRRPVSARSPSKSNSSSSRGGTVTKALHGRRPGRSSQSSITGSGGMDITRVKNLTLKVAGSRHRIARELESGHGRNDLSDGIEVANNGRTQIHVWKLREAQQLSQKPSTMTLFEKLGGGRADPFNSFPVPAAKTLSARLGRPPCCKNALGSPETS